MPKRRSRTFPYGLKGRRMPLTPKTVLLLTCGALFVVCTALFIAFSLLDNPVRAGGDVSAWVALRRAAFFITPLFILVTLPLFVWGFVWAAFVGFRSAHPLTTPPAHRRAKAARPAKRPGPVKAFFIRLIVAAADVLLIAAVCIYLRDAVRDAPDVLAGRVSVTTGMVTGLQLSGGRHKRWSFDVNGRSFDSESKIVQDGMYVRIAFYPHTRYMLTYQILD